MLYVSNMATGILRAFADSETAPSLTPMVTSGPLAAPPPPPAPPTRPATTGLGTGAPPIVNNEVAASDAIVTGLTPEQLTLGMAMRGACPQAMAGRLALFALNLWRRTLLMIMLCWALTMIGGVLGGGVLFATFTSANDAPQEAAGAALAVALVVVPYCFAPIRTVRC